MKFSPNPPSGRFGLVVAMSVYVSPPPVFFLLRPWTGAECPSSVDWCRASLALAWSSKNGEVFQIGRITPQKILDLLHFLFCFGPPNFFCIRGLVRSVTHPWTRAERPSPSRGALKTGRCSEMDA